MPKTTNASLNYVRKLQQGCILYTINVTLVIAISIKPFVFCYEPIKCKNTFSK